MARRPCRALGRGTGPRRQGAPRGEPELLLHDVHPGDELRHRVLHLEAGVHLQEPEGAVAVVEELARGGVAKPGRAAHPDRHRVEPAALGLGQAGCRGLLDQLLVAPLHRAVALADRDDVAGCVAEELHLDVAGRHDLALEVDGSVTERAGGLAGSREQRRRELVLRDDAPHAPTTASRGRLHEQGEADLPRRGDDRVHLARPVDRRRLERAGDVRHARVPGRPARGQLVAQRRDHVGGRPDPGKPRLLDGTGECLALGQEPVARVHGLRPRGQGCLDDGVDAQVALGRWRRAEADGGVGGPDVGRGRVRVGVDRDGLHPHLVTGPDDPERDLAPVRHEDAAEGWGHRATARARGGHARLRSGHPRTCAGHARRLCAKTSAVTRDPPLLTTGCSRASCGGSSRACPPACRAH